MWVLNSWAISNMALGTPLSLYTDHPQQAAFHQMNAGWNTVNAGLASTALLRQKPVDPKRTAQIFWVNAGLDIGYSVAGLWMIQHGKKNDDPQLVGWGNSILLQGGFLFCFDVAMGWRMMKYYR